MAHARLNDFISLLTEGFKGSTSPARPGIPCDAVARQDDEGANSVPVSRKGLGVASQLNAYGEGVA